MPARRDPPSSAFAIAVFVTGDAARYLPVVQSLRANAGPSPVVVGGPGTSMETLADHGALVAADNIGELVAATWEAHHSHVLVVGEPVVVPPQLLTPALEQVSADPRVATVSFLSNAAGFASFPFRNHPLPIPVAGHDAASITALLRATPPVQNLAPLGHATGGAVLLSSSALGLVGAIGGPTSATHALFVADFSARARRHGLGSYLDPSTYVFHADDLATPEETGGLAGEDAATFAAVHPHVAALAHLEAEAPASPLALALAVARTKVSGLRLLVDGSALGPIETGSQVGLVALAQELGRRDDVTEVVIALAAPLPGYAEPLRSAQGVRLEDVALGADLEALGRFDVAYIPRQPDEHDDVTRLRTVADRVVVTVLDLIAYRSGEYHRSADVWLERRDVLRDRLSQVDGVVAISDDVRESLLVEQVPVEESRVFVVPFGASHLRGDVETRRSARLPDSVGERPFLLCLGTNYAHKNRHVAIRAHATLVASGHEIDLVLAGPLVASGSSRIEETVAALDTPAAAAHVHELADVAPAERNWLLQHAAVLLYPSSAEGFGLVPLEAAELGTPAAFVEFGPLLEILGTAPVTAASWEPDDLATAVEQLLDEATAGTQVDHVRKAAAALGWETTAERLVAVSRDVLSRPPRALPEEAAALLAARAELAAVLADREGLGVELAAIKGSRSYRAASRAAAVRKALFGSS